MSSTLSEDGPVAARPTTRGRHAAAKPKNRLRVLGSIARSITVPVPAPVSRRSSERRTGPAPDRPSAQPRPPADTVEVAVLAGETVSDVAARYGVSTASLLALNGLSWRSGIAEGDLLLLRPAPTPPEGARPLARVHQVRPGETIATVAERHGVAVAALLLANGLSRTSIALPGTDLVVPAAPAPRPEARVELAGEMRSNARILVEVAERIGVPEDGCIVALVAAMQESCLHNLDFGVDDAVGLFQQRPSAGWGDAAALLDVRRAAAAFFLGGDGGAPGLLATPGWEFAGVGEAAQAVLRTSSAQAYGRWERCARSWYAALTTR